jgi:hypothetical protein
VHCSNYLNTVDENSPHIIGMASNEMWATGVTSATYSRPELRSHTKQGLLVWGRAKSNVNIMKHIVLIIPVIGKLYQMAQSPVNCG